MAPTEADWHHLPPAGCAKGVRHLSCMLWTVERGECRADRTLEESALRAYTGQDANAHQHAEQMLRQADCRSGRRDSPIGLTLFHASQEE